MLDAGVDALLGGGLLGGETGLLGLGLGLGVGCLGLSVLLLVLEALRLVQEGGDVRLGGFLRVLLLTLGLARGLGCRLCGLCGSLEVRHAGLQAGGFLHRGSDEGDELRVEFLGGAGDHEGGDGVLRRVGGGVVLQGRGDGQGGVAGLADDDRDVAVLGQDVEEGFEKVHCFYGLSVVQSFWGSRGSSWFPMTSMVRAMISKPLRTLPSALLKR